MRSSYCDSLNNCLSQINSQMVEIIVLYFVSALDLITTLCFLILFQEIKLSQIRAIKVGQNPWANSARTRDGSGWVEIVLQISVRVNF